MAASPGSRASRAGTTAALAASWRLRPAASLSGEDGSDVDTPPPFDAVADRGDDHIRIDGLVQHVISPGGQGSGHHGDVSGTGDHHDRGLLAGVERANPVDQLHAVNPPI